MNWNIFNFLWKNFILTKNVGFAIWLFCDFSWQLNYFPNKFRFLNFMTWGPKEKKKIREKIVEKKKMLRPGFEPGLLRPQRRVLTTRRSQLCIWARSACWNALAVATISSCFIHASIKVQVLTCKEKKEKRNCNEKKVFLLKQKWKWNY